MSTVLILRTADSLGRSHGGFQWPNLGPVECADWNPEPVCGGGLHGLLWGEGSGELLSWDPDARWQVVEVDEKLIVKIDDQKVKFPRGIVVFTGDRKGATDLILSRLTRSASVVGATVTAGYRGTATAGYRGTATAGYRGTATAGDGGTATAGDGGTATAGYRGTATAGDGGTATAGGGGTATAGYRGTLQLKFWDAVACRFRVVTLYVGEDGILPNTKYRLNEKNKPEVVK